MRTRDITSEINRKLRNIDRSDKTYKEKQKELLSFLKQIYGNSGEYSIQDIVHRKAYLQSKLDSQNSVFVAAGLAIITWLILEIFIQIFQYASSDIASPPNIAAHGSAAVIAVLLFWGFSRFLGRVDTKYRKYNLIDFELSIINDILDNEYPYENARKEIINTRFHKTEPEPSSDTGSDPNKEKTNRSEVTILVCRNYTEQNFCRF